MGMIYLTKYQRTIAEIGKSQEAIEVADEAVVAVLSFLPYAFAHESCGRHKDQEGVR